MQSTARMWYLQQKITQLGGKLKENNFAFRGSIDAMSTGAEAKRRQIRKEKVKKIEVARKKKKMERNKIR